MRESDILAGLSNIMAHDVFLTWTQQSDDML